jgi:hypothetical protein
MAQRERMSFMFTRVGQIGGLDFKFHNAVAREGAMFRKNHFTCRVLAMSAAASMLLAGCGGDDDPPDETSMTLTSFTLSTAALTPPATGSTAFQASFSATYKAALGKDIVLSAYLIPSTAASNTAGPSNRFVGGSCRTELFSFASCGGFDCTFDASRVLRCGSSTAYTVPAGSYSIVARACVPNTSNVDVCDEKRIALTVN